MIRKFNINDLNTVMNIWLYTNIKAHDFIPKQYWYDHFDMVKTFIPQSEVYVFEEQNRIKGFIGVNNGFIAGLFVKSGYRHQGIGKALIDHLKERYAILKVGVFQKNENAVKFYLKQGFEIQEELLDHSTKELEYSMVYKNTVN